MVTSCRIKLYINDNWFYETKLVDVEDAVDYIEFECVYRTTGILNSQNPEDDFVITIDHITDISLHFTKSCLFQPINFRNYMDIDYHYAEEIQQHCLEDYIKKQAENSDLYNALAHIYDKD